MCHATVSTGRSAADLLEYGESSEDEDPADAASGAVTAATAQAAAGSDKKVCRCL
jgi:hypothetical protein